MRVLVTRPEADAAALVAVLEARGHPALVQPLLIIEPTAPKPPLDLTGAQALLFTSANGVRTFAEAIPERDLPVLTVGDASAAAARAAGFARVESAGGDVEDLARLVKARLAPEDGALVHGAGSSLAGDLKGELEAAGFEVRRSVLYRAEPVRTLSEPVRAALAGGELDAVLFFSPRTAKTFVRLVADHGLAADCERLLAVCLSAAVTANLGALTWRDLRTAAEPTQQALLACLDDTDRAAAAGDTGQEEIMAQESAAPDPAPAQAVIAAFGGIRPMAHKLGVAVSTVQGWKERGIIPANRRDQVLEAAAVAGIEVDEAAFASAARPARSRRAETPEARSAAAPEPATAGEVLPPPGRAETTAAAPEPPEPERSEPEPSGPEPAAPPARRRGRTASVVTAVVVALVAVGAILTRDLWVPGAEEDGQPVATALDEPETTPPPAETPPPSEATPAAEIPPEPSEAAVAPEPAPSEAIPQPEPAPGEAATEPEPEPGATAVLPGPEAEPSAMVPATPQPAAEQVWILDRLDGLAAELDALRERLGGLEERGRRPWPGGSPPWRQA
jgi:uroporphyrinogen-III synthase